MWTKAINDQLGAIETILQNAKRIMMDHIGFDAKRAVKMLQTLNVSYGISGYWYITELYNFWSSEFISSNKLSLAKNMRYFKYMIAPL